MALQVYAPENRHVVRWMILAFGILVLAGVGWLSYRWYYYGDKPPFGLTIAGANQEDTTPVSDAQREDYRTLQNNPKYISMSAINMIRARIFARGIDENNLLILPTNTHDIAWYEKSKTPGSGGVIVMSGYGTTFNGQDGVLKDMASLQTDDLITVTRGDDTKTLYRVVENKTMSIEDVNKGGMDLMGKPVIDGKEGLNIMATDGKWIPRIGTFERRVMLRATIMK